MAVMRGVPWTPAFEFASSLQGRLDHAIAAPGDPVTVRLSPLYSGAGGLKITASVVLISRDGSPDKSVASNLAVDAAALPFITRIALPANASGDYTLEVRLKTDGEMPPAARAGLVKALPMHIEALAGDARKLRDRLSKRTAKSTALPSAAYVLDFYDRADRGDINPGAFHFREEFTRANEILDAIEAGKNPFAGRHGDFRKAYVSPVDQTV